MGGNTRTVTQSNSSQQSAPWGPAQPALSTAVGSAKNLFEQGIGDRPYTGSTVIPYSRQTMEGLEHSELLSDQAAPAMRNNFERVRRIASGGGFDPLQTSAIDNIRPVAAGEHLKNGNPYLDDVIKSSADDIRLAVDKSFGGVGRLNSGAHQIALSDSIGDMSSRLRFADYESERGRMDDAARMLFGAGQQRLTNQYAGTDALGNAFDVGQGPTTARINTGGFYEDLAARLKDDELRIFDEQQTAPWNNLARLNAIATGVGSLGGTNRATVRAPQQGNSGAGGVLSGIGLLGKVLGI